jgi:two-component system sensor histidine kinase RegB
MTDIAASDLRHPRRYIRLDTILRLRWLAVLGQLAAIFIVIQGLDYDVPVVPCVIIIVLSGLLNLVLQMVFNPMQRLEPAYAAALLALNIVELAGLLFFTGGLENPFSFLFLAPVLISATALPIRLTIALGVLAIACASALVFFHQPLPWDSDEPLVLPPIYLFGVWLSIVVAIGVTSLYAFQVTEEARKLSDALAATELVLTREQHLSQLDGLAAAAAHELGTPLSTIFLISRELERSLKDDSPIAGDLKTLREQAQRCRDILAKITQLSSSGAPFDQMPLSTLIEETVAPHRDFGVAIKVRIAVAGTREPVGARNSAILYGVGNILENAVDFARSTVEVNAWWNTDRESRPTCSTGSASPICRAGPARMTTRKNVKADIKASIAASVLGYLSPALCWNAPAPGFLSPTGLFRIMAPWPRSPGRGTGSKQPKSPPKRRPRTVLDRGIDYLRPWQRPVAAPYIGFTMRSPT